ncbi:thiamine pyrophosphokinase [Cypionkella aquatica]|uniref:Thiamine diphosphokinase n=1 Tax=Cypionkella aquatica TaxID=1756042 RepID=A0AA37U5E1_9RHOB|nr:thiamine diphosphokinase [Cypionkella aquatica]GLS87969.1 thiamine pyrophosphokinase [Cypionkella aquatica]
MQVIVDSLQGVTLAGGGPFGKAQLARALRFAPRIVGADGGADRLLALGAKPEAVIGDMDSISDQAKAQMAGRLFPIAEQVTTDFDKALRSIRAPFVLGIGFAGARLDHGLAVLNTLLRHPDQRCLVISPQDVIFLAPLQLQMDLPLGSRFSLFPMAPVTGESEGLRWPLQDLHFAPDAMIGTSNEVSGPVQLRFSARKMLVILPIRSLQAALIGLGVGSDARGG